MSEHQKRIHDAVTQAMDDVRIEMKDKDALTDEDFDNIYELTQKVVDDAHSSLQATAVAKAVAYFVSAFQKHMVELLDDPERREEFKGQLMNMMEELRKS